LGSINSSNFYHTKLSLDYAGSFQNTFGFLKSAASTFSWGGQLFDDRERFTGVTGNDFSGPGDPTLESAARVTLGRDTRPTSRQRRRFPPGNARMARTACS
jgi:hypothetical protein